MNDNLAPFRTQQLFVLVGTNPLPNYVAAKLLLAQPASPTAANSPRLYLVHTKRTDKVADRLVNLFPGATKVPVDETNAADIHTKITAYVGSGSMGLHYTGGTKAMAVHAYQALREKRLDIICSYLDARALSLQIDHPPAPSDCLPVELALQIPFTTLLRLHAHELDPTQSSPLERPIQLDTARVMRTIDRKAWRDWCDDDKLRRSRGANFKKDTQLRAVPLPADWPDLTAQWPGCTTVGDLANWWGCSAREVAKWLDGGWLEQYVLASVQAVAQECAIHYSASSVWLRTVSEPGAQTTKPRHFEIDVAALRGYQLFVLSCTTGDMKGELKLKLFEAFVRARQMGGDEARVALVCFAPPDDPTRDNNDPERSPAGIQRDMEDEWDARGLVRVFGEEHLPDLDKHLRDWFLLQANRGDT